MESVASAIHREPWNKGKIVGQKSPFKVKDIWALRVCCGCCRPGAAATGRFRRPPYCAEPHSDSRLG